MRVCFYVLLFSFRQLSQQLQLTAVIKADAADGDLPFYSLQITAQQADSFRFELVKAEQFFQTAAALRGQSLKRQRWSSIPSLSKTSTDPCSPVIVLAEILFKVNVFCMV